MSYPTRRYGRRQRRRRMAVEATIAMVGAFLVLVFLYALTH